jgi:hypothetical protein
MGKLEDYVSSLEGKDNLDPVVIASTLLELHKTEMGIATSKIASLDSVISEREATIIAKNSELTATKAENWDLVNRVPVQNDNNTPNPANDNGTPPTLEEVLYGKENS